MYQLTCTVEPLQESVATALNSLKHEYLAHRTSGSFWSFFCGWGVTFKRAEKIK